MTSRYYTVGHKKRGILLLAISLPIIDQFSKFFHWLNLQTICNNVIIIYTTTVNAFLHYLVKYEHKQKLAIITKIYVHEKKHFGPTLRWMICMTQDCVRPTQFSVIEITYCNVSLKCFFSILPKCLFVIIVMYAYFIDVSQSCVETHLQCGRICNDNVIASCLQSVAVKENFENRSIIGENMDKGKVPRFLAHLVVILCHNHQYNFYHDSMKTVIKY